MNLQLDTLRKAERVLTRDPEITSLIGSSDDELLLELRKETAEAKHSGKEAEVDVDTFMKTELAMPVKELARTAEDRRSPAHKDEKKLPPMSAGPTAPQGASSGPSSIPPSTGPGTAAGLRPSAAGPPSGTGKSPTLPRREDPSTSLFGKQP